MKSKFHNWGGLPSLPEVRLELSSLPLSHPTLSPIYNLPYQKEKKSTFSDYVGRGLLAGLFA